MVSSLGHAKETTYLALVSEHVTKIHSVENSESFILDTLISQGGIFNIKSPNISSMASFPDRATHELGPPDGQFGSGGAINLGPAGVIYYKVTLVAAQSHCDIH